jgi:hypothetical protein
MCFDNENAGLYARHKQPFQKRENSPLHENVPTCKQRWASAGGGIFFPLFSL